MPLDRIELNNIDSTWQNTLEDGILTVIGARMLITDKAHLSRPTPSGFRRSAPPSRLRWTCEQHVALWMGLREYAAWGYYWARGYMSGGGATSRRVNRRDGLRGGGRRGGREQ